MKTQMKPAIQMAASPKRTWRRVGKWTLVSLVSLVVVMSAAFFLLSGTFVGPALAPLRLPVLSAAANAGVASLNGTWKAGSGSIAGFRVQESFLTQSGILVGRSSAVTGSLSIAPHQISSGSFQVDLRKLTVGGKPNTSFFDLLETTTYPNAALTLRTPLDFQSLSGTGQTISATANGVLTLHGISHPVSFTVLARYNGSVLEALGTVPLVTSDWGIKSPFGVHKNATIEFLVVLHHA